MLKINNLIGFGARRAAAAGYTYWKIEFTNGGDAEAEFAELELMINGVDQTSGATITGVNSNGFSPSNAIDDNGSTKWSGFPLAASLTVQFASPKAITTYSIQAAAGVGHYPRSWTLQRSSDGSAYTTVDTQTGQVFTSLEKKTYTIP